ncbi:MAG: hypothetical protein JWO54_972 [Candidatus Saccharibacteria bacterium]|nr:hypothetical protein [Candidatus Saccharibacteria bacterium]
MNIVNVRQLKQRMSRTMVALFAAVLVVSGVASVLTTRANAAPGDGTWTQSTAAVMDWQTIASSTDGTKLAAAVLGGFIYTSTDSGATWIERTAAGSRNWQAIVSSADGTKLAATARSGLVYTSTDSRVTWTAQTTAGSR